MFCKSDRRSMQKEVADGGGGELEGRDGHTRLLHCLLLTWVQIVNMVNCVGGGMHY